jgi:ferrous iron transport protein B
MCSRGWAYIVKAATIILLCNTAVQIMQTFTWSLHIAETADSSILASVAGPFAYLLIPVIGYHAWQFAAASIAGFIAKENVVASIAVCYALTDVSAELPGAAPQLTAVAALAYLMFNLFTPPCFAAIGAMNSEMKSAKWLWGGIGLQLATGYTIGFIVYQLGTLITTGVFGAGFIPGLIAVAVIAGVIVAMCKKADKKLKVENTQKNKKDNAEVLL